MNLTSVTMGTVINEAQQNLYRLTEWPMPVTMGADTLSSTSDTSFTLSNADQWDSVNVGDTVEWADTAASEVTRVTAKSTATTPVYTVRRGWDGSTTLGSVAAGASGYVNTPFPRHRILKAIQKAIYRLDAEIPLQQTTIYQRQPNSPHVLVEANTRSIMSVEKQLTSGHIVSLGGWRYLDPVPTADFPNGKVLLVPGAFDEEDLYVTRKVHYTWSSTPPNEQSTLSIPYGSEGLLISFAVAYMAARREIGRLELDRVDEWSKAESARSLAPLSLIQELWRQFYRELEEAQQMYKPQVERPYRAMTTMRWARRFTS